MNIVVFGASGGTGREVVKQALDQRHQVTAFLRDPARLPIQDKKLRLIVGDVLNVSSVAEAITGGDAVVVALGSHDRNNDGVRALGTANIIQAMERQNVCRLIVVSAGGVGDSFGQLPLIVKALVKTLLRKTYADHEQQEQYVRDSHLEWVIVRPSMLVDGPVTGQYHTGTADAHLPGGKVTRADVADFVLKQLTGNRHVRQAVSIS